MNWTRLFKSIGFTFLIFLGFAILADGLIFNRFWPICAFLAVCMFVLLVIIIYNSDIM